MPIINSQKTITTNIPNSPDSILSPVAISNLSTGGNIGTAATTVDVNSMFIVTQTTAGQTLTLPNPTSVAGARLVTVQNTTASTQSFIMYGQTLLAGESVDFIWNGVSWSKVGADATTESLTYGRVNASADLPNTAYQASGVGTVIPFNATVYSSGVTFSGTDGIIPSVAGRYRAAWLSMAGSGDFSFDGIYNVVQNGAVVGSIFIDQMQAAGVNQTTPFIDVDLVVNQAVTLNYQPTSNDSIVFERGSYFQLTQLPTAVAPVVNTVAEYGENNAIVNGATFGTTLVDITGSSFILPTAGTWDVEYAIFGANNTPSNGTVGVYDASNVLVPNSTSNVGIQGSNGLVSVQTTQKVTITIASAATYKLRGQTAAGAITVANLSTLGINSSGNSKITWRKISGFLPSSGTTVDYISLVGETGDSFTSAPSFILSSDANGTITAVAPTTARLPFTTQTSTGTMTVTNSGNMTVASNNVTVLATAVYSINASVLTARSSAQNYSLQLIKNGSTVLTTSNGISGTSVTRDTQSINWAGALSQGDTIDIRVKDGGTLSIGVARYSLLINQLGSSNVIVTDNVALFGEQQLTATTIGNATVDITNGSFTLPSAGTWEVEYFGNISLNAGNIVGGLLIADTSNVEVANSRTVTGAGASGGGNESAMVSNKVRIVTSAPTTYKIRGIGNAANVSLNAGLAMGGAGNKVTWNLIAGTVPSTGTTVDYVFARLNADTTVANGSNIPFTVISGNIPMIGNEFILKAGKTYKLEATVAKTASDGAAGFAFGWTVLGVGPIGSSAQAIPPTATVDGTTAVTAYAIFTPTVDTQARVTNIEGSSRTAKSFHTSATITQLGSSAITTNTRVNVICRNKAAQSIPSSSWGNLTNWTEIQDPTNSFDPVTGVFTAPRTASYAFSTGNGFTVNTGTYVGQAVFLNNATQLYNFLMIAPTLAVSYIQTNGVIEMTAGQTLQARTFNGAGGAGNDSPSASNSWFTITEINNFY